MARRCDVFCVGAALVLLVGACVNQDVKDDVLIVPTKTMAKKSGVSLDSLGEGYVLYRSRCAQCHALKSPKDVSLANWHSVIPGMAWNAGMDKVEEKKLMAYLKAATSQGN